MKCPFLITKKEILDSDGKKVGEELEIHDCIKNDCMVYDGATKLCSLLSSNMKTGVLIDDVKIGMKEIKEELLQRNETLSSTLTTIVQSLQDALVGRFDILKKQNEVMVLGFDRFVETIINKSEAIKASIGELTDSVKMVRTNVEQGFKDSGELLILQGDGLKSALQSLQQTTDELRNVHIQFSEDVRISNGNLLGKLAEYSEQHVRTSDAHIAKLEIVREELVKFGTASRASMETMCGMIEKASQANQDMLVKLGQLDVLVNSVSSMSELIRTELTGLKTDVVGIMGSLIVKIDEMSTSFGQTLKPNIESVTELMKTEVVGFKNDTMTALNTITLKFDEMSRSLAETVKPGVDSMTELMRTEVAGLKSETTAALMNISAKFDELGRIFTDAARTSEDTAKNALSQVTTLTEAMKSDMVVLKDTLSEKLDGLGNIFSENATLQQQVLQNLVTSTTAGMQTFKTDIGVSIEGVKSEITTLRTDQIATLNNLQGTLTQLESLFKHSSDSLGSMSDMMKNLNSNYIESLGKIAGLAEGMRKGVAQVGEGMHASVKDLVKEMKSEIGALEKQYEKTFGDIANLAGKFAELNKRIKDMTKEVETEFKSSFDRQEKLSSYTKTILEHIKEYFEKEDVRYKEERVLRKKKEGIDHFDRATLYYYRGNYEISINEINKALEIDKTAEYFNLKGLLLTELGKFDESKKVYKEALKLEPNLAEIHNNLGLLYIKMKKLDDAVVSFQEAVKKNVNYALAYVNLGKALIELEKYDDAIKAFEKALKIDPSNVDAQEAIKLYKEGKIGA